MRAGWFGLEKRGVFGDGDGAVVGGEPAIEEEFASDEVVPSMWRCTEHGFAVFAHAAEDAPVHGFGRFEAGQDVQDTEIAVEHEQGGLVIVGEFGEQFPGSLADPGVEASGSCGEEDFDYVGAGVVPG